MLYNNYQIFIDAFNAPNILVKDDEGNEHFKSLPILSYEHCGHKALGEIADVDNVILYRCMECDELIVSVEVDGLTHCYSAEEISE